MRGLGLTLACLVGGASTTSWVAPPKTLEPETPIEDKPAPEAPVEEAPPPEAPVEAAPTEVPVEAPVEQAPAPEVPVEEQPEATPLPRFQPEQDLPPRPPAPPPPPPPPPPPEPKPPPDGRGHFVLGGILISLTTGALLGAIYVGRDFVPAAAIGPLVGGAGLGILGGLTIYKGNKLLQAYGEWGAARGIEPPKQGGALTVGGGGLLILGGGLALGGVFSDDYGVGPKAAWLAAGATAFAGGVTMMGFGIARHRRWRKLYSELEATPGVAPVPGGAALTLTGRFAL